MPTTIYEHPCWCVECREECKPVKEVIGYAGTHCANGRSGTYETGHWFSHCCGAEMTNERYDVDYYDVLNDFSMVKSEKPDSEAEYRWRKDAVLESVELGTCKKTNELHYVRITTIGGESG